VGMLEVIWWDNKKQKACKLSLAGLCQSSL